MGHQRLLRLRWRLRGAWQWPAFAALTVADAVLLHELPVAGEATRWMGALLLAVFFNLAAVAVAGPVLGWLIRRRRGDLPAVVARDYGGTTMLVAVTAILVVAGLVHRPALRADRDAFLAQSAAARWFVAHQAPAEFRAHIDAADSVRFGDVYRTCVPGVDPARAFCVFVDMSESPPGVRPDTNPVPNDRFLSGRFP